MNRLFLPIIASILALSILYGGISLSFDGKANPVLVDFTENSEGEIEAIDIRLFMIELITADFSDRSKEQTSISYSEKLIFVNFLEVLIPPPKG